MSYVKLTPKIIWAFQVALVVKNTSANAGDIRDASSIPVPGNPLQNSCLENPMDRGSWRAMVRIVTKSQTQLKQLSTHTQSHHIWPT